jgi:hypothetical protein
MMDCLYAECTPCITDCVLAELEKLGQKYRVALKIAKVSGGSGGGSLLPHHLSPQDASLCCADLAASSLLHLIVLAPGQGSAGRLWRATRGF